MYQFEPHVDGGVRTHTTRSLCANSCSMPTRIVPIAHPSALISPVSTLHRRLDQQRSLHACTISSMAGYEHMTVLINVCHTWANVVNNLLSTEQEKDRMCQIKTIFRMCRCQINDKKLG
eukprot:m.192405 g.192405  ORF g.192405 m.192405 type:complete len:119 (-) comp18610_c0_seq30:553-909(-)